MCWYSVKRRRGIKTYTRILPDDQVARYTYKTFALCRWLIDVFLGPESVTNLHETPRAACLGSVSVGVTVGISDNSVNAVFTGSRFPSQADSFSFFFSLLLWDREYGLGADQFIHPKFVKTSWVESTRDLGIIFQICSDHALTLVHRS